MPFISFSFALFSVVLASIYFALQHIGIKNNMAHQILLLAASLVFYGYADIRFLPVLFYIIVITYCAGWCRPRRIFAFLSIAADLLPLLLFKYSRLNVFFPLGISFFTFQSISYIADVYTKKVPAERNFITVALFVSFFPTISSGPIQRPASLLPQLKAPHRFDYDSAADGMRLFAWGMCKKLLVADRLARYVDFVYRNPKDQYGLALLLATALYSFQIYADFSGYSDMAAGCAKFFGFAVGKNFDHPYLSTSVGEFWRRWHISLSSWLRDYVYIPLGGSRVARPRIYANLLITFVISGVWHGSAWHFVAWGLLHGIYLCAERIARPILQRANFSKGFKILITFALVSFAWIFFRASGGWTALLIVKKIAHIPLEFIQFADLRTVTGTKEDLRILFSLTNSACGGFKGMAGSIVLLVALSSCEALTVKTNGLSLFRAKKTDIRWAVYALCILALVKVLPLTLSFDGIRSYSSNFIYQNF